MWGNRMCFLFLLSDSVIFCLTQELLILHNMLYYMTLQKPASNFICFHNQILFFLYVCFFTEFGKSFISKEIISVSNLQRNTANETHQNRHESRQLQYVIISIYVVLENKH